MATKSKKASAQMQSMPMMAWVAVVIVLLIGIFVWIWQGSMTVASCSPSDLNLTAGQQSGAAGTIYQHMILTNTGNHKCQIGGYPTAFLYGSDGYAIGNGAAARPQPAPVAITLAPGDAANTVLGYPQAGNFDPGVCSANKSTSVKIYVPGAVTALDTPLEVNWCPGFSESSMQSGS